MMWSGASVLPLDSDVDRLYQLPLEDFTAARHALAARLKAEGDPAGAERVRALEKPSASAWAINQLYWRGRREYEALVAAGDRLRRALAQSFKGAPGVELRGASEARERAVASAVRGAVEIAERAGSPVSAVVRHRIATTCEAIVIQGAITPGRLVDDLPLPGFAALAALAPAGSTFKAAAQASASGAAQPSAAAAARDRAVEERARGSQLERRARIERARADLKAADASVRAAREALMKASLAEHEAAMQANAARLAMEDAKAQLDVALAEVTRARAAHALVTQRAGEATAAAERAVKTATEAREILRRAQTGA